MTHKAPTPPTVDRATKAFQDLVTAGDEVIALFRRQGLIVDNEPRDRDASALDFLVQRGADVAQKFTFDSPTDLANAAYAFVDGGATWSKDPPGAEVFNKAVACATSVLSGLVPAPQTGPLPLPPPRDWTGFSRLLAMGLTEVDIRNLGRTALAVVFDAIPALVPSARGTEADEIVSRLRALFGPAEDASDEALRRNRPPTDDRN